MNTEPPDDDGTCGKCGGPIDIGMHFCRPRDPEREAFNSSWSPPPSTPPPPLIAVDVSGGTVTRLDGEPLTDDHLDSIEPRPTVTSDPSVAVFDHLPPKKRHWGKLKHAARAAGLDMRLIQGLWQRLPLATQEGLLRLPPDQTAIERAKAEQRKILAEQKREREEWEARRRREAQAAAERRPVVRRQVEKATTPLERVKCMLWAIEKCGTIADARDAFERAIESIK